MFDSAGNTSFLSRLKCNRQQILDFSFQRFLHTGFKTSVTCVIEKHQSPTCFNFIISSYFYCDLPSTVSFPPTHSPPFLPSFLPSPPNLLDVFTSQILISKTSAEALAVAPSRQLHSSQRRSISSASLCLLFCLMR